MLGASGSKAVVDEGLSMLGNSAHNGGFLSVGLGRHLLRVDVSGSEREAALAVRIDGVLVLSVMIVLRSRRYDNNLIDPLNVGPNHDHHVAMHHGDFENLLVTVLSQHLVHGEKKSGVALRPEAHR